MPQTRDHSFWALARAAEVVGERWTLLIVRELLLGPKRFTDLRDWLDGIRPSVLTERLARAEGVELVRRAVLPPPAASVSAWVAYVVVTVLFRPPAISQPRRWGAS